MFDLPASSPFAPLQRLLRHWLSYGWSALRQRPVLALLVALCFILGKGQEFALTSAYLSQIGLEWLRGWLVRRHFGERECTSASGRPAGVRTLGRTSR